MKVRDKWRFIILIVIVSAAVLGFRQVALSVFPDHGNKCSLNETGCPKEVQEHNEGGSIIWDSLSDHLL